LLQILNQLLDKVEGNFGEKIFLDFIFEVASITDIPTKLILLILCPILGAFFRNKFLTELSVLLPINSFASAAPGLPQFQKLLVQLLQKSGTTNLQHESIRYSSSLFSVKKKLKTYFFFYQAYDT